MAKKKMVDDVVDNEPDDSPDPALTAPEPPPADPQPELGKHIFVDIGASGHYELMTLEDAKIEGYRADAPERKLTIYGTNVEHTDTHPSGVWCYRKM